MCQIAKALVITMVAALAVRAQTPLAGSPPRSVAKPEAVEYLFPEQISVPAATSTAVALHFRVAPGLHINSHAPKEQDLIPTVLIFPEESGVRLESATYPQGAEFAFPIDPKHPLSVYAGEFLIRAHIVATRGSHMVEAKLRYQACDNRACMPPRTITAPINVIGK